MGFVASVTDRSITLQSNYAKMLQVNIIVNSPFHLKLMKLNLVKMVQLDFC